MAFRDQKAELDRLGAVVLGVSRDSLKSHENFAAKYQLPFPLLSDQTEEVCRLYGVLKQKNMYDKTVMGIERSTFLIDEAGIIRRIDRKVKVDGHVGQVLEFLRQLGQS